MQMNSVEEYKKMRKFILESELPTISTSRGLQKGITQMNLELKISDLIEWLEAEKYKKTFLYSVVRQEISLILDGNQDDEFDLYLNDENLKKAYSKSAKIKPHRLNSRNVAIINSDNLKCIQSLFYLPPFDESNSIDYRLTHRSFDIKAAGYSDLLIAAWLIMLDAEVNNILDKVLKGTLYWNINNVTVYVESDGITPKKGVARKQ